MQPLFVVAVVACLAAGIHCQLLPTEVQVKCIDSYLLSNPESSDTIDYYESCSELNLITEPLSACSNRRCLNSLGEIFPHCGLSADFLSRACAITPPSSFEIHCAIITAPSRAVDIVNACGNIDVLLSSNWFEYLEEICSSSACFDIFKEIYSSCGYSSSDEVCGDAVKVFAAPILILAFALLSILF